jgi:hypothetical protein
MSHLSPPAGSLNHVQATVDPNVTLVVYGLIKDVKRPV